MESFLTRVEETKHLTLTISGNQTFGGAAVMPANGGPAAAPAARDGVPEATTTRGGALGRGGGVRFVDWWWRHWTQIS